MPFETPRPVARKTPTKLAVLTAVVLLAHVGLLFGSPLALTRPGYAADPAFTTRMIAPAPTSALLPPEAQPPKPSQARVRPQAAHVAPAAANPESVAEVAPTLQADASADTTNLTPPADAPPAAPAPSAYGVMSQLLAASGPPANLNPVNEIRPLAAADEAKPTASGAAGSFAKAPSTSGAALNFAFPPPLHLKYKINGEVKGFSYYVNGDLQWKQDGKTYEARMEVSHFLLGSRVQTSRGDLGAMGLEPIRFGDKVRSEVAAHFDRTKGKVTFSANTPDVSWVPGMQDHLSALVQLGSMLGGSPNNFPEGSLVPFEAVGPRSVESWVFKVGPQEKLNLPGGLVSAIKLVREAVGEYGTRGEVWLAPSLGYLPVRIRLIEANGNFVDQKWAETVSP
jgi:hypothetical protein